MKYGLGFRYACLGPCEVVDQGGLDVHHHIATYLWEDLSDAKYPSGEFEAIYQAGNYGVKTGKGFYDYSGDKADKAIELVTLCTLQWLNATQQVLVKHTATRTNISSL